MPRDPYMTFKLSIKSLNAGMLTAHDVAQALRGVARMLEEMTSIQMISGPVRDVNGNTVGTFELRNQRQPGEEN